eukprot:52803-Eustigmatos_ZCMA.PRE.1
MASRPSKPSIGQRGTKQTDIGAHRETHTCTVRGDVCLRTCAMTLPCASHRSPHKTHRDMALPIKTVWSMALRSTSSAARMT